MSQCQISRARHLQAPAWLQLGKHYIHQMNWEEIAAPIITSCHGSKHRYIRHTAGWWLQMDEVFRVNSNFGRSNRSRHCENAEAEEQNQYQNLASRKDRTKILLNTCFNSPSSLVLELCLFIDTDSVNQDWKLGMRSIAFRCIRVGIPLRITHAKFCPGTTPPMPWPQPGLPGPHLRCSPTEGALSILPWSAWHQATDSEVMSLQLCRVTQAWSMPGSARDGPSICSQH